MPAKRTMSRTCQFCGSEFFVAPSDAKRRPALFCSALCRAHAKRRKPTDRFWEKVETSSDCWLWIGATNGWGYGTFSSDHNGHTVGAHRFSYELYYGPIPDDMTVCHTCDVRNCVRPDHLFLGTTADNMADKVAKGRQDRGERNGMAKLTEDQVREIRKLLALGHVPASIASQFGVTPHRIRTIKRGASWKHLT